MQESRKAALAENQPLPMSCRVILDRLKQGAEPIIGHTGLVFGHGGKPSGCTPSQAQSLVKRNLAEIYKPDPRGPRRLRLKAVSLVLSLALCLLACSCAPEGGSNTVQTVSEGSTGLARHEVVEIEAGGATHHLLFASNRNGSAIAVTKLCTTFDYDGNKYYVDSDGKIYEWRLVGRQD